MMKSERSFAIKKSGKSVQKGHFPTHIFHSRKIRKPFSAISQVLGFPHDILALRILQ